jgi:hypothetical protein
MCLRRTKSQKYYLPIVVARDALFSTVGTIYYLTNLQGFARYHQHILAWHARFAKEEEKKMSCTPAPAVTSMYLIPGRYFYRGIEISALAQRLLVT